MNIMKISAFHLYLSCFFFCLFLPKIICNLFLRAETLQTVCLEDQHCGSLHHSSKCHRSWSFVSVSRGLQRWGKLCFIRETQAKTLHSLWPALKTKAKTLPNSDTESHRNSVPAHLGLLWLYVVWLAHPSHWLRLKHLSSCLKIFNGR